MFNAILAAVRNILAYLFTILQNLIVWLWDWGWAKFLGFWALLGLPAISLPTNFTDVMANNGLMPYLAVANDWVPIKEAVLCLSAYTALYVAMVPLKLVLRRIPGING